MLAQIPGVSIAAAQSLMVEYKTIKNLVKALDEVGRAQLRAYLKQHDELSQLGSRQVFVNYPSSTSSN